MIQVKGGVHNMKKKAFLALLITTLLPLTSCTLFNDKDLEFKNEYHPKPLTVEEEDNNPNAVRFNGVVGKQTADVENTLLFQNVYYAFNNKIVNTYKIGGENHIEYNVNDGQDYEGDPDVNNYDLYLPNSVNKTGKHLVVLLIHGGAWVGGFKKDMKSFAIELAKRGYIVANLKYTLLSRDMNDKSLSIFRDLDEIDASIASIKNGLENNGFTTSNTQLALCGGSSGSHLSMLYAYSRGDKSVLPIKFIMNAVGPVDIKPAAWKRFIDASEDVLNGGLSASAIATQESASNITTLRIADDKAADPIYWNNYETMRIANGMCGLPYTLAQVEEAAKNDKTDIDASKEVSISMTKTDGGEDQLSVTYWLKKASFKIPMICAYAGQDSVVGINQYATLQAALNEKGYTEDVDYTLIYFKNCNHTDIKAEKDEGAFNSLISTLESWSNKALQ